MTMTGRCEQTEQALANGERVFAFLLDELSWYRILRISRIKESWTWFGVRLTADPLTFAKGWSKVEEIEVLLDHVHLAEGDTITTILPTEAEELMLERLPYPIVDFLLTAEPKEINERKEKGQ
jgi:hypothetical protein